MKRILVSGKRLRLTDFSRCFLIISRAAAEWDLELGAGSAGTLSPVDIEVEGRETLDGVEAEEAAAKAKKSIGGDDKEAGEVEEDAVEDGDEEGDDSQESTNNLMRLLLLSPCSFFLDLDFLAGSIAASFLFFLMGGVRGGRSPRLFAQPASISARDVQRPTGRREPPPCSTTLDNTATFHSAVVRKTRGMYFGRNLRDNEG